MAKTSLSASEGVRRLSVEPPAPRVAANGVHWLAAEGWERHEWLWHGFSTRKDGRSTAYAAGGADRELNLGFTGADYTEIVKTNRRLLAEAITGGSETPLWTVRQIHSNRVIIVGADHGPPPAAAEADGLMTDQPGVLIAVQTADCIPVLVADRKRRVVAAFHAGWRGTVRRIVEAGVGRMRLEFGSRSEDLIAAVGPGIGQCCYGVGEEVWGEFGSQFEYAGELFSEIETSDPMNRESSGDGMPRPALHLNLVEANRRQLVDAGVRPEAVQVMGGCTSCWQDLFFSHRASGGHTGRMMSVIGVRPEG